MNLVWPLVSVLVPVTAALDIIADMRGKRSAVYVLKPLTTGLIIVVALLAAARPEGITVMWALVVAGLLASLAGDVFLMLPGERIAEGLASFLLAHLLYIAAFGQRGIEVSWVWAIVLLGYAGVLVALLWRHVRPRLHGPVAIYAVAIAVMVWTAIGGWLAVGDIGALTIVVGAFLFLASDSVLSFQRFVRKTRWGQAVVLTTYFAAQWLIAVSMHLVGPK